MRLSLNAFVWCLLGCLSTSYAMETTDVSPEATEAESCCSICPESCCDACDSSLFGFGVIKPSDHCFDRFISPVSNPLFFEDPRTLTELRFIFVNHWFPQSNPVMLGGNAQVYAMQFRAALTDACR